MSFSGEFTMSIESHPTPFVYVPVHGDELLLDEARLLQRTMKLLHPQTPFGANAAVEVVYKLGAWMERNNLFAAIEAGSARGTHV